MTDVQAWLDQGRTLTDQATEGPWEARSSEVTMNDRSEWKIGKYNRPQSLRSVMRGADAAFIADARTRLPAALDALQAIHDMHRRIWVDGIEYCKHCVDFGGEYPCPTVRAIQAAIGGTE